MKKILKYLRENKILYIILIIIALGFPTAVFKKAQGEQTTIVVAVGIDKKDGKYQVSIQSANSLIKPMDSASVAGGEEQKLEVIDGSGLSISDAINEIEIKTGRHLGFEHCHLIVMSDGVTTENCKSVLDFFYRKANITLGTYLISTDESAKTILDSTNKAQNTSINVLQQNLGFNKTNYASSNLKTLGDFFNEYYMASKTSSMAFLKTSSMEGVEGSVTQNNGESAIFQNGRKVAVIDKNLTYGLNFVNLPKISGDMVLTGVNDDEIYKNATVSVKIDEGEIKKTISTNAESVSLNLKIQLRIEVLEVINENNYIGNNLGSENFLTEALKGEITKKVQTAIDDFHSYCKENKIDACEFLSYLNAYKNSEYKNLTSTLTEEEILNRTRISTQVEIYSFR